MGTLGSLACSNTRRLNSSKLSSRLMYNSFVGNTGASKIRSEFQLAGQYNNASIAN